MREQFQPIATNLTPVRVVGIPGLALVVIAIALAVQFPEARWLLAVGLLGGIGIAMLLIRRRAHRPPHDTDRWSHGMLGVNYDDTSRLGALESDRPRGDRGHRRGAWRPRLDPVGALTLGRG